MSLDGNCRNPNIVLHVAALEARFVRAAARLGISLPTLRARLRLVDGPRIAQHRRRAA